jgi:hypothetical protein
LLSNRTLSHFLSNIIERDNRRIKFTLRDHCPKVSRFTENPVRDSGVVNNCVMRGQSVNP